MSIFSIEGPIKQVFVGSQAIEKIYVGSTLIWPELNIKFTADTFINEKGYIEYNLGSVTASWNELENVQTYYYKVNSRSWENTTAPIDLHVNEGDEVFVYALMTNNTYSEIVSKKLEFRTVTSNPTVSPSGNAVEYELTCHIKFNSNDWTNPNEFEVHFGNWDGSGFTVVEEYSVPKDSQIYCSLVDVSDYWKDNAFIPTYGVRYIPSLCRYCDPYQVLWQGEILQARV